ncbi:hypothetical protein, partial [Kitasatospora nipponensis]
MTLLGGIAMVAGLLVWALTGEPNMGLLGMGPVVLVVTEGIVVRGGAKKSAELITEPWTVRVTEQTYSLKTAASEATVEWRLYREV